MPRRRRLNPTVDRLEGRALLTVPPPVLPTPVPLAGPNVVLGVGDSWSRVGAFTSADPTGRFIGLVSYSDGPIAPLPLNPDNTFTLSHQWTMTGHYVVQVEIVDSGNPAGGAEGWYFFAVDVVQELPLPAPSMPGPAVVTASPVAAVPAVGAVAAAPAVSHTEQTVVPVLPPRGLFARPARVIQHHLLTHHRHIHK